MLRSGSGVSGSGALECQLSCGRVSVTTAPPSGRLATEMGAADPQGHLARDVQAKPTARLAGSVRAAFVLEDPLQGRFREAGTRIRHREGQGPVGVAFDGEDHAARIDCT